MVRPSIYLIYLLFFPFFLYPHTLASLSCVPGAGVTLGEV